MENYQKLFKYAKQLALKWRHTKKQIEEKLTNKGASVQEKTRIISSLVNSGILDDRKTFELDVFMMEEKRYGYKRVKEYLIKKGYSNDLLEAYIFNKDIEKDNCVYQFTKAIKKHKNYKYEDDEREKVRNYLKRCGFNDRIINEVIKLGISYENVM